MKFRGPFWYTGRMYDLFQSDGKHEVSVIFQIILNFNTWKQMSGTHEGGNKPGIRSKPLPSFVFNNADYTAEKVIGTLLIKSRENS